jgi:hypothetical protein
MREGLMRRRLKFNYRAVRAALTLTMALCLSVTLAPTVRADIPIIGPIIGEVNQIKALKDKIEGELDAVLGYITQGKPQSQLDKIKSLVSESQSAVINEIDAVATVQLQGKCDTAVDQFDSINTMDASQLANLVTVAVECVNTAKDLINTESDKHAVDADALALNAVAPIARPPRQKRTRTPI